METARLVLEYLKATTMKITCSGDKWCLAASPFLILKADSRSEKEQCTCTLPNPTIERDARKNGVRPSL